MSKSKLQNEDKKRSNQSKQQLPRKPYIPPKSPAAPETIEKRLKPIKKSENI